MLTRREQLAQILGRLPALRQAAVAGTFEESGAAGEVPGSQWLELAAAGPDAAGVPVITTGKRTGRAGVGGCSAAAGAAEPA